MAVGALGGQAAYGLAAVVVLAGMHRYLSQLLLHLMLIPLALVVLLEVETPMEVRVGQPRLQELLRVRVRQEKQAAPVMVAVAALVQHLLGVMSILQVVAVKVATLEM